jgi:hypothetical protein
MGRLWPDSCTMFVWCWFPSRFLAGRGGGVVEVVGMVEVRGVDEVGAVDRMVPMFYRHPLVPGEVR